MESGNKVINVSVITSAVSLIVSVLLILGMIGMGIWFGIERNAMRAEIDSLNSGGSSGKADLRQESRLSQLENTVKEQQRAIDAYKSAGSSAVIAGISKPVVTVNSDNQLSSILDLNNKVKNLEYLVKGNSATITTLQNDNTQSGVFLKSHPVGSIYVTIAASESTAAQMSEKYGGQWQAYAAGRVLVGADGSDDFTIGTTGGEKVHMLSEEEMPSHSHSGNTDDDVFQVKTLTGYSGTTVIGKAYSYSSDGETRQLEHNHSFTTNAAGGGLAHNNLQPYITVYMWQRIS
ncbi:MAG: hypothetical protein GX663_08085 [Clostridiales bacterium]|nr:hypothetical protein [Clostridiales bacterium]